MTYSIILLFVFVSLSYVYCQNNAISPSTTQTTPALNKENIQVTTLANNNPVVLVSSSSSETIAKSSITLTEKHNPLPTKSETEKVVCGNITCSMYQKCNNSTECYCPPYESPPPKKEVCGSDGYLYNSIEELEMKACNEKSNVTEAKYSDCTDISFPCGGITCSKHQACHISGKCICPTYVISKKDENGFCGSDGHMYKSFKELKMKACKEKRNIISDENGCQGQLVPCGGANCSIYQKCESGKCYCPPFVTNKKKKVCGSDGHVYSSLEELKIKACKEKRNITKDKDDHCKSWQKKSSNKKTITIIVIISLLLILVLVIVVILFLKKRREALSISEPKKDKSKDALL